MRTTQRIRNHAVAVLSGIDIDDLDGQVDSLNGYHSLRVGKEPVFGLSDSEAGEEHFIEETLRHWMEEQELAPDQICVCARTAKLLESRYRLLVESMGKRAVTITTDSDEEAGPGIRLATMHRLKGLEDPAILVAGLAKEDFPQHIPLEYRADPAAERDRFDQERRLLFVAMTRARDTSRSLPAAPSSLRGSEARFSLHPWMDVPDKWGAHCAGSNPCNGHGVGRHRNADRGAVERRTW